MNIQPHPMNNPSCKTNLWASAGFVLGVLSVIYPFLFWFLVDSNAQSRGNISYQFFSALFYLELPLVLAGLITGITALIQLKYRYEKGKVLAIFAIVLGALGLLFNYYLAPVIILFIFGSVFGTPMSVHSQLFHIRIAKTA